MRIAVLDDYQHVAQHMADWSSLPGAEFVFLHEPMRTPDQVVQQLAGFDALVAMRERTKFPATVLERLPRLRLLVTTGLINRSIDLAAATRCGITVCGTPWAEDTTVELAWAHILALSHGLLREDAGLRAGRWQTGLGMSLKGKTLGVLGLGTIGTKVARVGALFGMQVIAYSPNLTPERAAAGGAQWVNKAEFFQRSDVLSVHLILGPTTRGIVGTDELALMKPTAFLVNTARGPLVDEVALACALREGRLAGAGVDVYSEEPIPADHPLLDAPNTVLTPHIGYVTQEVYATWYGDALRALQAFAEGHPIRVLNPPAPSP